jgi:ribosomal protein L15
LERSATEVCRSISGRLRSDTYKDRESEAMAIQNYLGKHVFPSANKFSDSFRRVQHANLTGGLSDLELINIAVAIQKKFAADKDAWEIMCSEKEFDVLCRRLEF